jgi:hypothetical protein
MFRICSNHLISSYTIPSDMLNLDALIYPVMGFAATFLSLETAWHFTAYKSHDRDLKPCVFKQVKGMAMRRR